MALCPLEAVVPWLDIQSMVWKTLGDFQSGLGIKPHVFPEFLVARMKWSPVTIANQAPRKIAVEKNYITGDILVRDHWCIRSGRVCANDFSGRQVSGPRQTIGRNETN